MKRLLSILLAIMMVATLLPAGQVFATEGEANQGITIRYDFSAFMAERAYRWNESGPWLTNINYESTNGLYKYASSSIEQKEDDGSAVSGNNYYGGSNRHNPYLTVSAVAADDYYFQLGNNYRLSFEIYVPVTGKYKMNVGYADCKDYDGVMSVYMNQGEKPEHAWNYKISQYVCEKRGADRRYKLSTTLKKWDTKEDALLDTDLEIELTKGYHFITFKSSNYGYIKYLELVSGDGSGKAPVYAKSSIDANLLNLDGQKNAKMSVHGVYLSTGEAANGDEYSVSFRSTDEAVAIVDNDGNITAKGVGEADIIADVMIGGASFETKQHVSVEEKGVKIIYNLAADMATLGMNWGVDQTTYPLSLISYENTKNFYALHESSRVYEGDFIKYSGGIQLQYKGNNMSNPAEYVTFEINVPAAGTYDVDILTTLSNNTSLNTRPKVFFSSKGKSQADEDYVGDYNVYVENVPQGAQKLHVGKVVVDKPGKYYITFSLINDPGWRYTKISTFTLTSGTNNALMNGNITSTSDTINVDNGENATVSATGFISSTAEAATFTYSSSNTDIATVDAETGLVTPLKEGKVTITATANGAEVANTLTTDITVTVNKPGEAIADTMVNVGIEAMPGGTVQTNLTEVVSEVEIGTKVSATATAADGYEFAYWADATGKVLSTKAEETFTINVNTSVKAYFEKIPAADAETAPVYFYNGNRDLIEKKEVNKGTEFSAIKIDEPTLTGFEFTGWSIDDATIINNITRAVALFKETNNTYTVKAGDTTIAGKKYGESVTVTSEANDFVCWKLGDKIMSYEKSFTFDVYGDITLTEETGAEVKAEPTVVLDTINGEHFLTYNVPAGYTKLEAGILFAERGKPTIGSFHSKATEKTGSGQFTAKPNGTDDTIARGYMIFRDSDNSIRVIYAD